MDTSPITKSVRCPKKRKRDTRVLTLDEQAEFLAAARRSIDHDHFLFILQTGIRSSGSRGLIWCDIDLKERIIHIRQNAVYDPRSSKFIIGALKTSSGQRWRCLKERIRSFDRILV